MKNRPSTVGTLNFYARGLFAGVDRMSSRQTANSASTMEGCGDLLDMRRGRGGSLYDLNTQFERLVSGQESEAGEKPPAYGVVGRSAFGVEFE